MQLALDELYAASVKGQRFCNLVELIKRPENIKLAYRNIRKNSGSRTAGVDNKTISDLNKWNENALVAHVQRKLDWYVPNAVRRVEIPKDNGKTRPLGIPTIMDRLIQQCILQVLEPICEAKFFKRSNGFRPNHSAENAIAQAERMIQNVGCHYVIDIDIKSFFDNVNHGKLLKQMWTLGIRDKKLLSIISTMLKAEVAGIGFPEKGTPQGGIISPLLSNIVLNELDWWIVSQWEEMPTQRNYVHRIYANGTPDKSSTIRTLRNYTNLKECYVVRYADDFKIFCKKRSDAVKLFEATKQWLLKTINRLIDIDSGTISIDGKDIQSSDKVELRRHIGYVIQQIGLFPNMTVAQNICVVPRLLKYDKARCDEIVRDMLKMVNMESSANKYPSELSGGQQQRIGVLRALAASPPIVLMDEPFSALDPMTREVLQDEVKNLQQKLNKTIVFVSHDMGEALKLADTIIFMAGGEIVQMASPEEMLEHPANDLVQNFLGKHAPGSPAASNVEHFMRTNVQSVRQDRGVLECAERMARAGVDTLLVTDAEKRYLGTISIGDIRHWGRELKSIEPLIRQTARTARVGDDARESFDYLLDSGASYVVVLNGDDTIAGIVTKTSVARSVAENLWGNAK